MGKRRTYLGLLLVLAVGVVAGVLALVFRPVPEPRYGGKKLSEWVEELPGYAPTGKSEAAQAVRHIGTNAIPFLLEWLRWEPSALRIKLQGPVDKMLTKISPALLKRSHTPYTRSLGAWRAFQTLGPRAAGAIPELSRLMTNTRRHRSGQFAAGCLANIGTDALPPLMSALTNQNPEVRGRAAVNMERLGTNAGPALPLLIECLNDKEQSAVWGASQALIHFKRNPHVLPALADCVRNSRQAYRWYAIMALGRFGHEALPAVPLLLKCLKDPDANVRLTATNALRQIDPDALEKTTAQ